MIRIKALSVLGAMAFATAGQVHAPRQHQPMPVVSFQMHRAVAAQGANTPETITVYYSPLESTKVTKRIGFGMAYHMALVYTDGASNSYGASSGPSNAATPQTPGLALQAIVYMANDQPSGFGTLVSDPLNDHVFQKGGADDYYTQDRGGHVYPHALAVQGRDLSARWASILQTYAQVGSLGLTYSPTSQNSNSLANTALRRAGIEPVFSSETVFTPDAFTQLPID